MKLLDAEAHSDLIQAENRYQWLLDVQPDSPSYTLTDGQLLPFLLTEVAFAGILSLPPVSRATGVGAQAVCLIVAAHALVFLAGVFFIRLWARRNRVAFHVGVSLQLVAGVGAACAFPALNETPGSILWSLPIVYSAFNGSMAETRPARLLLGLHVLGPLLVHVAFGRPDASYGAPLMAAGLSAASYHFLALRGGAWRALSARHTAARERLREQEEELSRMRLARELHDGVGSTLGLLALHASLLERHKDDPEHVMSLAALTRDAARGGLDDLRGVLEAVAPEDATLESLGKALDELAVRTAPGIGVSISVKESEGVVVSAAQRLAVVRTFQEALRNAVLHGEARKVRAILDGSSGLVLELHDDGVGFDVEKVRRGRGLSGMQARSLELGGLFEFAAKEGAGATIRLALPAATGEKAS